MIRLLFLALLFFTFSCSQPPQSTTKITINISTEPPSLDPRLAPDVTSMALLVNLFEGLTRVNKDNEPKPALAESIEISEDGKEYTFKLKESLWSDGTPLTARDFYETWSQMLDPKFPAPYAYKFYDIQNAERIKKGELSKESLGVEVPNPTTLIVKLQNPTPHFLELMAQPTFFPLPWKHVEEHPDWAAEAGSLFVSNGPFSLQKWAHEQYLTLVKNPLYWDAEHTHLEEVECLMINDGNTEFALFEVGDLQWTGAPFSSIPTDIRVELKEQGRLSTLRSNSVEFLLLNTQAHPLNNVHIRRALSLAINRKEIIEHVLRNDQEPALSLVPNLPDRPSLALISDGDIQEAKKELALGLEELGHTQATLPTIRYSFNTSASHKQLAEVMQSQWKRVLGIDIKLDHLEWKLYLPKLIHGDYQIGRMGWVGEYHDPKAFLYTFSEPPGEGNNLSNFNDPEFNRWMEEAQVATDPQERMEALKKAETRMISQMPIIPLFFSNVAYLKDPRLKNVLVTSLLSIDFKEAYLTQ